MSTAAEGEPLAPAAAYQRTLSAIRSAHGHLKVYALKLLILAVAAFLLLRLTPAWCKR